MALVLCISSPRPQQKGNSNWVTRIWRGSCPPTENKSTDWEQAASCVSRGSWNCSRLHSLQRSYIMKQSRCKARRRGHKSIIHLTSLKGHDYLRDWRNTRRLLSFSYDSQRPQRNMVYLRVLVAAYAAVLLASIGSGKWIFFLNFWSTTP